MAEDETAPVEGQAAWTDGFPDELKGYIETKGFQDPAALATSYQNLEKLRGVPEDKLLRLPDDPTAPGALDPIYEKLGRPESPDAYTNALGEGFDDGVFKAAAEKAHALGLGDEQFKGLQEIMQEQAVGLQEAKDQQDAAAFDAWKQQNPDGFANAARVMADVGMSEETVAAMLSGDKTAIYDFAAKIGARTAEAPVVQGEGSSQFALSPTAAKAKVTELMADKQFMEQYTNDNQSIRSAAVTRMEQLQKIATGG